MDIPPSNTCIHVCLYVQQLILGFYVLVIFQIINNKHKSRTNRFWMEINASWASLLFVVGLDSRFTPPDVPLRLSKDRSDQAASRIANKVVAWSGHLRIYSCMHACMYSYVYNHMYVCVHVCRYVKPVPFPYMQLVQFQTHSDSQ